MADRVPKGAWIAAYLALSRLVAPAAAPLLRRRLKRGKEDPARWREKLGIPGAPRPEGPLVWLHAVGVGEVLALRGLVAEMTAADPRLNFLLTSTARSSAQALARNLPPRAVHQFLPLDLPGARRAFLDYWRPDLSVWAEQDLWPGLVTETARRGIPLALVNARMNEDAHARRARARGLFAALYPAFRLIAAQDSATARHLEDLGAPNPVRVTGSLKPGAPPLADKPDERARLEGRIGARRVWLAASTHLEDEVVALGAHVRLRATDPDALLILVPRIPERGAGIAEACRAGGLLPARRSLGNDPDPEVAVYIADTMGETGLWYRIAPVALVGGTFGPVEGHNPWEPARLGAAILHGPRTANFAADYESLDAAGAARQIASVEDLLAALSDSETPAMPDKAARLADAAAEAMRGLARDLAALLEDRNG